MRKEEDFDELNLKQSTPKIAAKFIIKLRKGKTHKNFRSNEDDYQSLLATKVKKFSTIAPKNKLFGEIQELIRQNKAKKKKSLK